MVTAAAAALAIWLLPHAPAGPPPAHGGGPPPGTIMTVAGGVAGPGPATRIALDTCPISVAGNSLYAGDDEVVRRIDTRTGWLTTPVGDGTAGDHGIGGPAAGAELEDSTTSVGNCGLAAAQDGAGNLLIADGRVYVVAARTGRFYGQPMLAGHIYRLAGSPYGVVDVQADRAGNLVMIADGPSVCGSECTDIPGTVQVLAERTGTWYGRPMQAGRLYTLAGQDESAEPGNGGPAARAGLGDLAELRLDSAGNVLIADTGRTGIPAEIRVIAARDGRFYGQPMRAGYIYAIAGGGHRTGNGVPGTSASVAALGVTHDRAGNVIIGDSTRLRVVAAHTGRYYGQQMTTGGIYTVSPPLNRRIIPEYVAVDSAGNLVFADGGSGTIRVLAERTGRFYGRAMRPGHLYIVAGSGQAAAPGKLPALPAGVASDSAGDLVIGYAPDTSSSGLSRGPDFVPARTGRYFGLRMHAGRRYPIPVGRRFGACPDWVATDRAGNVVIADQPARRVLVAPVRDGRFYGQRMRVGQVYPVAGDGRGRSSGDGGPALAAGLTPGPLATDRRGDIFVLDSGGNRVRMVPAQSGTWFGQRMTAGHIYTVAGASSWTGQTAPSAVPATGHGLFAFGLTADAHGNLVLAAGYRVRVVALHTGRFYGRAMRAGYVYTVAGPFPGAHDVAVDRHGNILLDDASANVIRLIAERSGQFYGQQVTAGHSYVIAGHQHGPAGLGAGGPATQAWLDGPDGIAIAPDGRLLIAEYDGARIQAVTP
jgi:sugar lactone lactonase YvrE